MEKFPSQEIKYSNQARETRRRFPLAKFTDTLTIRVTLSVSIDNDEYFSVNNEVQICNDEVTYSVNEYEYILIYIRTYA